MRSTVRVCAALACALIAVACQTSPDPLSDRRVSDLGADPPDDAPPPADELEDVQPVDVVVPDMFAGDGDASSAEQGMTASAASSGVLVFVNGAGGTYTAGRDDAPRNVSSVLSYYGRPSVSLPASGYTGARWEELMSCLRAQFTPYAVTITDKRPVAGGYAELVISNTTAGGALGISNNIGGIAPLGACRVVPQAVGFVFQRIYDQPGYGGVRGACEAAAHEIGHSLSLSHEQLSTDLMSYAPANPAKRFQDAASACGVSPSAPESCTCGAATQNSHRQLLTLVGANTGGGGAPGGGGGGGGGGDTVSPKVSIVSPTSGVTLAGNATIEVVVDATDDKALADVKLVWQFTQRALACDGSVQGVTCVKNGGRHTWSIAVGTGARSFYAQATDAAGNTAQSPVVTVQLGGGQAPPASDAPPSVTVHYPIERQLVTRGAAVLFQAAVADDRRVTDVRAVWYYQGGSLAYPMAETTTPGVYQAQTTVSASAAVGWRAVEIQATDDKGQRTVSPRRDVYVQ